MNADFDVTGLRIETPRLILRPWQESDLEDFFEYASVPGVGEMAGWPHHESVEASREILNRFIEHKKTFALEYKENGKAIGSLGLELRGDDPHIPENLKGREIGYVLSKDYWGRGLMCEAVCAVISYCFGTLHFDFLTCGHFAQNYQSRRVIEKCGFKYFTTVPYTTAMGTKETVLLYMIKRGNNNV